MGGHAFHRLYCPRISRELYMKAREQTTNALRRLFTHVVVPTELPSKNDYGDIDFLVAGPLHARSSKLDWLTMVTKVKNAFNTEHGKRGYLNPDIMYFAISAPGREGEFWIQVDVKVCAKVDMFEWETFQLNYASGAKMIGSLVKPLGLTIDPEGLHIRVEELEKNNLAGSMVFLTREPRDVLKIVGLDRRILNSGFRENDELYEYFAGSWLFNPAHFAERLKDEKYAGHLEDRSAPWLYFVTKWILEHCPGYRLSTTESSTEQSSSDLQTWYKEMRVMVREEAFTMFPSTAPEYYEKRRVHLKEVEEHRLRKLLMSVIPSGQDGWTDEVPQPRIIIKPSIPVTPELRLTNSLSPVVLNVDTASSSTAPSSPNESLRAVFDYSPSSYSRSTTGSSYGDDVDFPPLSPFSTPLILEPLPRSPPSDQAYVPRPPPGNMSIEAKLLCLARWTLFHPDTGTPYLAQEPREKKFEMSWVDSGTSDEVLVKWAQEMWWAIWVRQHRVNYVGMWKRTFEKDDAKAAKRKAQTEGVAEAELVKVAQVGREKTLRKLKNLNERMGMVSGGLADK